MEAQTIALLEIFAVNKLRAQIMEQRIMTTFCGVY